MRPLIDAQQRNALQPQGSCRALSLAATALKSPLKQSLLQTILPLRRWQRRHALQTDTRQTTGALNQCVVIAAPNRSGDAC